MVRDHLQVTGRRVRFIGTLLAIATMFGLDPAVDGVLDVEHRTGMGATPNRTERNPQGVGDGVREATIGAGGHIQR